MVTVKLVHEDGSDHTSCSLDSSEERKNALCKKIGPFNRMIAEYVFPYILFIALIVSKK